MLQEICLVLSKRRWFGWLWVTFTWIYIGDGISDLNFNACIITFIWVLFDLFTFAEKDLPCSWLKIQDETGRKLGSSENTMQCRNINTKVSLMEHAESWLVMNLLECPYWDQIGCEFIWVTILRSVGWKFTWVIILRTEFALLLMSRPDMFKVVWLNISRRNFVWGLLYLICWYLIGMEVTWLNIQWLRDCMTLILQPGWLGVYVIEPAEIRLVRRLLKCSFHDLIGWEFARLNIPYADWEFTWLKLYDFNIAAWLVWSLIDWA